MFAVEKLNVKTHTGLDICIVCDRFGASSSVNSDEIVLEFRWKVCSKSIDPIRNFENPTLTDYFYEPIAGVAEGVKTYSNSDLRIDLEIVDGVPTPKFQKDENGDLAPVMIGNIDFWIKFGGSAILQDLEYTLSQIGQQPVETFIKEYQSWNTR